MSFYSKLTIEQIHALYGLVNFLKRLRVIGHLELRTVQAEHTINSVGAYEFIDFAERYKIVKDSYDPTKIRITQEELLEKIFGRLGKQSRGTG